jgi:hypothetical protein
MTLKYLVIGTAITAMLLSSGLIGAAFATSVSECRDDGFEDGKDGEWDLEREHECGRIADQGNPYRDALEDGCYASGAPRGNCEEINH